MRPRHLRPAAALLVLLAPVAGFADTAGPPTAPEPSAAGDLCLLPDRASPGTDRPFAVALRLGGPFPGDAVPWSAGQVEEMFVTDLKGRRDVADPVLVGDPAAASFTLRIPGTAIVSLATGAEYVETPGPAFTAYLREEGDEAALEARRRSGADAAPGRERRTRHLKTIVDAGGPSGSVALSRVGLALEIVPEAPLADARPGGRVPVRVFYRDLPYADGPICATWDGRPAGPDDYAWCGRLDGAGRASVPIEGPGWQMIRATRMIPLRGDPRADWHSFWAALTFHVDAPPAKEGATP